MSKRTKKVGPVGRFQSRYGVRARTITKNIEIVQKAKHQCPICGQKKVKRIGTAIWQCKKCGTKFTGGAYSPVTESGQNVEKMLKGEFELPELPTEESKDVEPKGGKK
ncbi:MAG: 50S ribosomal protein L37Ae [Candidatus Thermoplasmatota archaeon]|jgi:large subunit ribosomal protein L37Ae|nr:50S ribosomal protein L37Ae [Candidatus Thermoplasmatota archaeon]